MTDKRTERILRIIKALKEVRTDRGASMEEAMAAAARISDLMTSYDISEADVSRETSAQALSISCDKAWKQLLLDETVMMVARLTDTAVIGRKASTRAKKRSYEFHGTQSNLIWVEWLCEAIQEFVIAGLTEEEAQMTFRDQRHRNAWRNGYLAGAADKIRGRIKQIIASRDQMIGNANLPALPDRQKQLVDQVASTGKEIMTCKPFDGWIDPRGHSAGRERGAQAPLGKGVSRETATASLK